MLELDRDRLRSVLIYSVPVLFLLFFLVYPLLSVFEKGLFDDGGKVPIHAFQDAFTSSRTLGIIRFTLLQALLSTSLTIAGALPGAYLLSKYRFPGRSAVLSLTTVPFVLPPLLIGIGFLSLFGTSGLLQSLIDGASGILGVQGFQVNILYSKGAIVLAHVFLNFPIALRILNSGLDTMDEDLIHASRSLGAGPLRTFSRVVLPQMRYSLLSAASLIFTFCLLTFGVVLVVGGMSNATLEVEIYRQFNHLQDPGRASVLLLMEILLVFFQHFQGIRPWKCSRIREQDPIQDRHRDLCFADIRFRPGAYAFRCP
mgnify:CR=1 FL=1